MRLLKRRFGEIGRGRLIGPDIKKTRFEHLKAIILDDYRVNGRRSLETVNAVLKALSASFGDDYARDITLDRLNGYVASRLEKGRQPATIVNELAERSVLRFPSFTSRTPAKASLKRRRSERCMSTFPTP